MKHLHAKGATVNIFQMSVSEGLLLEGTAVVVKAVGDASDEHYMVRFHSDIKKYGKSCTTYERFIDREGQGDPEAYIREFNKRIGYKAA